jgi:hypothetical protein
MAETEITPEFQRGWDAALIAARQWHEDQAKKALVQSLLPSRLKSRGGVGGVSDRWWRVGPARPLLSQGVLAVEMEAAARTRSPTHVRPRFSASPM